MQVYGIIVVRRVDYLFLAMIAFAAAVASAPPPPRIPAAADIDAWAPDEVDQVALSQLDPSSPPTPP